MGRPRRKRCVSGMPEMEGYKPFGIPMRELLSVRLLFEEYESIRLCDYLGLKQEEAAVKMGVSRPTLTRIYENARKTVATAFAEGKAILIEGGDYTTDGHWSRCPRCRREVSLEGHKKQCEQCDKGYSTDINLNLNEMKIALPTKGNMIDDHFGQCENFTVFTIDEKDEIAGRETIPSMTGCGCKSGIAAVLQEKGVEIMLAGNMGDGALNVLKAHGIAVFRGCTGDVTGVTQAFLRGEMKDSGESCRQHHGGGDHGQHHGGGDHGQHHGGGDHGQHHSGGGHGQHHGGGGHGQRGNN